MRTEVYWVTGRWPGKVGIVPRPRGGDWLEDEVRAWRASGIDIAVSLLRPEEVEEFDLQAEESSCRKHDIRFLSFPITDRGVPSSPEAAVTLARTLAEALAGGQNVAVHCRQGIGRSALMVALALVVAGEEPDEAFALVEKARGRPVPDTKEQRAWVGGALPDRRVTGWSRSSFRRAGPRTRHL